MEHNERKDIGPALPFFSVIIATYNRAMLLKRAMGSLMAQAETDWEAIIIDDGSIDETQSVMALYKQQDTRIRYCRQENKGAVASKNEGIRLSKGKFITFLDSDDEYDIDHLSTRKKLLIENKAVEFLHGGIKIIGSPYVPDRFEHGRMIHLSECVIGGTFFISKQLAALMNGFKEIPYGFDADFFERAKQMGVAILKTSIPTYVYHHETPNSITNAMLNKGD
ncbi:MAG: glycosyltransferase family 2 protein [Bacteroidetes bacterium]|nr:glycosyltransferase family 2 protein [Bacteroidota bacterium]MBS1974919.1 glycosyltransferase family 2 protein [Bacteroidota bacterium]